MDPGKCARGLAMWRLLVTLARGTFGYGEGKDKIQVNSREMRGEELAAAPTQTILSRAFSKKGSRVLEC